MEADRRIFMKDVFLDYSVAIGDESSSACSPSSLESDSDEEMNQNPVSSSGLDRRNQENIGNESSSSSYVTVEESNFASHSDDLS